MTGNIHYLDVLTGENLSVDRVMNGIQQDKPEHIFVIAWPENGSMPTYHSTTSDMPTVLMRLNEFIHKYYNGDFNDE